MLFLYVHLRFTNRYILALKFFSKLVYFSFPELMQLLLRLLKLQISFFLPSFYLKLFLWKDKSCH